MTHYCFAYHHEVITIQLLYCLSSQGNHSKVNISPLVPTDINVLGAGGTTLYSYMYSYLYSYKSYIKGCSVCKCTEAGERSWRVLLSGGQSSQLLTLITCQ